MRKRAVASLLLGGLFSALCLWYAFRGVDLAAMTGSIARVGTAWVLASVVGCLLSLIGRAIRWRYLLDGSKPVSAWSLISATFIGMMANNLLPARLGEVVRAWVLAKREAMQAPAVLASIVVERLLDMIALVALLGVAVAAAPPLSGRGADVIRQAGAIGVVLCAAGGVGVMVMARFQTQILRATERWLQSTRHAWGARGIEMLRFFLEGLSVLRGRMGAVAWAVGLSFITWAFGIASLYLLAQGFELGLTIAQSTLVFVVVLFGIAVPSAPGFVGTFHGFCVAGLILVAGTDPTVAAAFATLLHGGQWLAINLVGVAFLTADRTISWSSLTRFARQS